MCAKKIASPETLHLISKEPYVPYFSRVVRIGRVQPGNYYIAEAPHRDVATAAIKGFYLRGA